MTVRKNLPVRLIALSEMKDNIHSYRIVKVKNCYSNKFRTILIPSRLVYDKRKLREILLNNGLAADLDVKEMNEVFDEIKRTPNISVPLLIRPGFFDKNGELCYATGNGKIIGDYEGLSPRPYPETKSFKNDWQRKGRLVEWQDNVATAAIHSPQIMLSLCSAVAGFCTFYINIESGGFHIYGDSSKGKSTAVIVAASVYGGGEYVSDWNTTEAAFEELAESRNHSLVLLDELVMIDTSAKDSAQKRQKLVYALASGHGKARSGSYQPNKAEWRLTVVSNGESAMEQHALEGGQSRKNGEKARLVDVPADSGYGMGLFRTIPDDLSPSTYAESIIESCGLYHGIAGPLFVKKLLRKDKSVVTALLEKRMQRFFNAMKVDGNNGLEKRIAKRFAFSFAAGSLAAKFKIFPFGDDVILEAIAFCYMKAIADGSVLNNFFSERLNFELKNATCQPYYENLDSIDLNDESVIEYEFKNKKDDSKIKVLAVKASFFKENLLVSYDLAISILKKQGKLLPDASGKATRQINYKGRILKRRYCLIM